MHVWGSNAKGQLGIGHYTNQHRPMRLENLPHIKELAVTGHQNLALSKDGDVYLWPSLKEGERVSLPQIIPFVKTKLTRVACGYNFAVLVTT